MTRGTRTFAFWMCLLSQALCVTFAFAGDAVWCRTPEGFAAIEPQAPDGDCEHAEPADADLVPGTMDVPGASGDPGCTDVPLEAASHEDVVVSSPGQDLSDSLAFLAVFLPLLTLGMITIPTGSRVQPAEPDPDLASPQRLVLRTVRLLL